jgi:hypothetical protein
MFGAKDSVEVYQLEKASNISREGDERAFGEFEWFVYLRGELHRHQHKAVAIPAYTGPC